MAMEKEEANRLAETVRKAAKDNEECQKQLAAQNCHGCSDFCCTLNIIHPMHDLV
jgi:hypothetical protein